MAIRQRGEVAATVVEYLDCGGGDVSLHRWDKTCIELIARDKEK